MSSISANDSLWFPEDASSEQTQVVLPNLDAGSSSAQSKSSTNSLQWDDIDDNISDSKVLAASIGHTLRNKREDAPLNKCRKKIKKTKMAALARSIDLNGHRTILY